MQVSILSVDFTQGARPRGGGDFSLLLKSNRQEEEDSRQGDQETMAATIYLKGFSPFCLLIRFAAVCVIRKEEGGHILGNRGFLE